MAYLIFFKKSDSPIQLKAKAHGDRACLPFNEVGYITNADCKTLKGDLRTKRSAVFLLLFVIVCRGALYKVPRRGSGTTLGHLRTLW